MLAKTCDFFADIFQPEQQPITSPFKGEGWGALVTAFAYTSRFDTFSAFDWMKS